MAEIDDDAGEETGFGYTQQEAYDVELRWRPDKCGGGGNETPRDQDASEPFARAPTFDQQRAGNFKNEVADEKNADAQPENFFGKVEVAGHAELGEAYIGPVEICDQIEQDDQRQDAPGYFATERRNIFGAERCTRAGGRLRFV